MKIGGVLRAQGAAPSTPHFRWHYDAASGGGYVAFFQTSIQKRREGRIAPALSALENNSRQLHAQLAAKAGQASDRESEEQ